MGNLETASHFRMALELAGREQWEGAIPELDGV